jgi:molybdopterin molybdotransferase
MRTLRASVLSLSHTISVVNSAGENPSLPSYQDAARTVQRQAATIRPSRTESVVLLESLGRTIAQPIVADRDQPPFARSTRDGFACRSSDLASLQPLEIVGHLRAGEIWRGPSLKPGQTIEIMTGAPLPEGADCVLMVEHSSVEAHRVTPARILHPGENIVPAGAEARAGATLVEPGTRLEAQHIALSAACGYETLTVFNQPRIAILATGDELVPLGQQPLPHQIRNSNSYSLAAQITRHGGRPIILPAVPDDLEASEAAIRAALDCDLLILSGGVSMGKYDFVEQALSNLHAEFFFTGARIQPGKPVVFGHLPEQGIYFLGLPGNPVSTLITFALFAAPLLAALAGQKELGPEFAEAKLTQPVETRSDLTRFLPARLESSAAGATIQPIPWQGSGDQTAAAKTNCFLVVPEQPEKIPAGTTAIFLRL